MMYHTQPKPAEALQDQFGTHVAARLSEGASALPYDISERLRAARAQAVASRRIAKVQAAPASAAVAGGNTLTWGSDEGFSLWSRIGSILPLIALVVGLLAINSLQSDKQAQELAEVDSALLTDELPPDAFSDPGFVQFLKTTL